jgi:hypothetical protein
MERLERSVREALSGVGVPDAGALAAMVASWPHAVGDAVARAAWPLRLGRDGTLHVACVSSTWAFELDRMADEIRRALAAHDPAAVPERLRFATGPVPSPGLPVAPEVTSAVAPTAAEQREAARLAGAVEDEELRAVIARGIAASLARRGDDRFF